MRAITLATALTACGGTEPCSVIDLDSGAVIECPDGTRADVSDGAAGLDGLDGSDGTDNRIVAIHGCTGALQNTAMDFIYQVSVMRSGDVFAYGGVWGGALQVGASFFYAASQPGAALGAVIFQSDNMGTANGGFWTITLNRATGVTTIVYNDTEATGGSDTWTMPSSVCVVSNF